MDEPGVDETRVRLQKGTPWPAEISREELRELLRTLMDEYRFQVKLNSDRTQVYLVLNAAIITAATGLLKAGGPGTRTLVAAILLLGVFVARIAARAVKQGHDYYRAIVYKKTLVEDLLGRHRYIDGYGYKGATLAIETTVGMSKEREILDDTENWLQRPVGNATITGGLIHVFNIFACVDAFAVLFVTGSTVVELTRAW